MGSPHRRHWTYRFGDGSPVLTDARRKRAETTATRVVPVEIATELGLRHWGTRTVVYADERREERPVTDVT